MKKLDMAVIAMSATQTRPSILCRRVPFAAKENDSADDRGWNDGGDMELNGQWRSGKRFEIHLKAPVEFRPAFNKTALPSNEMASNAG